MTWACKQGLVNIAWDNVLIRITAKVADRSARACRYLLAGEIVAMQNEIPVLDAYSDGYATDKFSDLLANTSAPNLMSAANSRLQYFGRAPLNGVGREIRYWRSGHRAQIDIAGQPGCQINFRESHIHVLNDEPLHSALNVELVTGPALVILLSMNSTYCLHAGAVSTSAGNIGIIAESGAGKSTLAKHVDERWRQISDDILPIRFDSQSNSVKMLPAYPQLKLPNATCALGVSEPETLNFLLRVNPEPSARVRFKRLPKVQGMLQVVRHTVGAKLFDTEALVGHADFAKQISIAVPVIEVSYPRKHRQLSKLRQHITNYLENPVLQNSAKASKQALHIGE